MQTVTRPSLGQTTCSRIPPKENMHLCLTQQQQQQQQQQPDAHQSSYNPFNSLRFPFPSSHVHSVNIKLHKYSGWYAFPLASSLPFGDLGTCL
jgi:hypothetical protein